MALKTDECLKREMSLESIVQRRPRYADSPFPTQGQRDHLDFMVMAR
ncbi:MAG: hypothetical protein ACHRXM_24340 [Isosphaerales bacterium]